MQTLVYPIRHLNDMAFIPQAFNPDHANPPNNTPFDLNSKGVPKVASICRGITSSLHVSGKGREIERCLMLSGCDPFCYYRRYFCSEA